MALTIEKWRPQSALVALEQEMDRFMDDFFGRGRTRRPSPELAVMSPDIEMVNKKDEIVVKADVPGAEKGDIHVSLDNDLLTISGETKKEKETKDEDYYFCERSYGTFSRSVRLPIEVKADKVSASLENGVLEIHLPKADEAKQKHVTIEVGAKPEAAAASCKK